MFNISEKTVSANLAEQSKVFCVRLASEGHPGAGPYVSS